MALIQCPECEGKVSDQAKACIHCGCPLDECSAKGNRLDGDCSYSVVMNSCGYDKIAVIKVVREFTGLGLKEAKDLVEAAPALIAEGLSGAKAEGMRCSLEEAGADVSAVGPSKLDGAFAKGQEKSSGFWFVSEKGGCYYVECRECGNVVSYPSYVFKGLFSHTAGDNHTHKNDMRCSKCGNTAKSGRGLSPKPGAQKSGVSFWGIVGAILVVVLILCFF